MCHYRQCLQKRKCLKKEPELAVLGISGSVLEDVRTRLR